MNFEMPSAPSPKEEKNEGKKTERLSGAVAGVLFSVGMMAGQAVEAQTVPDQERHEQMEQVASGVLSHSKEAFVIALKKGSSLLQTKSEAEGGRKDYGSYSCDDVTVQVGGEAFTCKDMRLASACGVPYGKVKIEKNERMIILSFYKPMGCQQGVVPENAQGEKSFYYYMDTKYEEVHGPIAWKWNIDSAKKNTGAAGVFPLGNVQLKGVLEKLEK